MEYEYNTSNKKWEKRETLMLLITYCSIISLERSIYKKNNKLRHPWPHFLTLTGPFWTWLAFHTRKSHHYIYFTRLKYCAPQKGFTINNFKLPPIWGLQNIYGRAPFQKIAGFICKCKRKQRFNKQVCTPAVYFIFTGKTVGPRKNVIPKERGVKNVTPKERGVKNS